MSAWIVSQAHIDVLVLAGVQYATPYDVSADLRRGPNPTGLTAAGVDLWAENHRSVNFRYDEHTEPPVYSAPTAEGSVAFGVTWQASGVEEELVTWLVRVR